MAKHKADTQKKNQAEGEMKGLKRVSGKRSGDEAICIPFAPHLYPLFLKYTII